MPTLSSSVPHASLLLALQLSARPLNERELAAITGLPEIRVRSALRELSLQKHVAAAPAEGSPDGGSGAPAWAITRIEPDLLEDMAETLCSACPDTGVPYHMGVLGGDATLEDCEIVVRFIDDRLKDNEPAVFACFEMVVQFLLRWGRAHMDDAGQKSWRYAELVLVVQSMCIFSHHYLQLATELSPLAYEVAARNNSERFMPMIWIFRQYLQLFSGGEPPLTDRFFHGSEKMRHFKEQDMQDRIPVFEGIENFLKGHFRETLQCYARRPAQDHWWYKRFFEPLSFCASQAAMYLREYPLATGIIESARQTAELAGERLVAMLWIAHLCFLLLRKGALDEAIVKIDYLLNCVPPEQNHKIASSAVRALAVYHHLSGRTDAAYRVLRNETLRAAARGVPHSPFLDPLVLDLLYVFEQRGYPPIPRYEVEATIETFLRQPNRQLRGTALRAHALRLRGRGAPAEEVVSLLHDSLRELEPTGDPRELVLTHHELATMLEAMGQHREAHQQRKSVAEIIGHPLDENASYRTAAIAATGEAFPALAPTPEPEAEDTPGRILLDRCHAAFNREPTAYRSDELFQHLLDIAQQELQSERAALFRPTDDGRPEFVASVNLTRMELESDGMRSCMEWLESILRNAASTHSEHQRLCLALDVGEPYPWLLYMDSAFTSGMFQRLSPALLHDLARLFAAEVRSGLRLELVRTEEASQQQDRLLAITRQKDGDMIPVVGEGLRASLEQALRVGITDAPVLILGETGVGKEIMARNIHQISLRSGPFVVVHPASMPESLFESEFFGYERGAFTGAIRQKIGLFELADQGTLFIDEVGEIPPLIQTKLLRVLQDQRFMRLGGTREILSRFRLVAATNRDLWKEVREGRFREDLLYRISVVPLTIPPLRERKQDIPGLVQAFIEHFARRHDKHPLPLSPEQQRRLCEYDWPGNVRELKNEIERAVILNNAGQLDFVLGTSPAAHQPADRPSPFLETVADVPTLSELEERYLRHIMERTEGRVRGPRGAETLLRMKRSTLYAKLKKYGIPCGSA